MNNLYGNWKVSKFVLGDKSTTDKKAAAKNINKKISITKDEAQDLGQIMTSPGFKFYKAKTDSYFLSEYQQSSSNLNIKTDSVITCTITSNTEAGGESEIFIIDNGKTIVSSLNGDFYFLKKAKK